METLGQRPSPVLADLVRRHALGWLVAANAVGALLAAELIWPRIGQLLGPLTYGRWMPLHLDWQLYGWCALPLAGALLAGFLNGDSRALGHARLALAGWSLALALGGVAWLSGTSSGKLFLEWGGWARPLLPLALAVLWLVLAIHTVRDWRLLSRARRGLQGVLLASLLPVPVLLFWAENPTIQPAINPASGGATGWSLLGSTLGIIAICGLLPLLLGVRSRTGGAVRTFWLPWAATFAVFALVKHGNVSHHAISQVVALGLLLVWVPLLIRHLDRFEWSEASRPWRRALFAWWAVLVVTGWLTFLPGISERLKFTNGLVAHAHLAMAGLVTSLNFVVLNELNPQRPLRRGFGVWHLALAVQSVALLALGWFERDHPAALFRSASWTQAIYGIRLLAGGAMLGVSIDWARQALGSSRDQRESAERSQTATEGDPGERRARILAGLVGSLDFLTGIGLVLMPAPVLAMMGVGPLDAGATVFLRWVGAFVTAVGASYLIALIRGGSRRLWGVLEFTISFRLAAGSFAAFAILRGWLEAGWVSVPVTDFLIAGLQAWLLRCRRGDDD